MEKIDMWLYDFLEEEKKKITRRIIKVNLYINE